MGNNKPFIYRRMHLRVTSYLTTLRTKVRVQVLIMVAMVMTIVGCSPDDAQNGLGDAPTGRAFGGPSQDSLFAPYQGSWTLEGRTFDPPLKSGSISGGPDISINGHIIRFASGMLVSELRLCQARKTNDGIACEAWHHEDIHDPGDMQRADCKLRIIGDKLELHWRIADSADFTDDSIIALAEYVPPRQTNADNLTWWIETYARKPAK